MRPVGKMHVCFMKLRTPRVAGGVYCPQVHVSFVGSGENSGGNSRGFSGGFTVDFVGPFDFSTVGRLEEPRGRNCHEEGSLSVSRAQSTPQQARPVMTYYTGAVVSLTDSTAVGDDGTKVTAEKTIVMPGSVN
jgi:hypothetical protein